MYARYMSEICLGCAREGCPIYVIIGKISISCDTVSELVSDRPGSRDAYASNNMSIATWGLGPLHH